MPDINWNGAQANVQEYLALRAAVGMSERSPEGARVALRNTLFSLWLRDSGRLIGMGRIIGDGGCFVQLNDVAIHPDYQGQGYGTELVNRMLNWCESHLPPRCMINLIANEKAVPIYERAGFFTCQGMARYNK